MQQSNSPDFRKKSLKKYWKGYDECGSIWKACQLRGTSKNFERKEIEDQLKDAQ